MTDISTRSASGGAVGSGYNRGTSAPSAVEASQPLQSAALTNAMFERLGRLDELANRLEMLTDRIVGSEPAKPTPPGGTASTMPGHVTARMDACVEIAEMHNSRIADALRRLERFA